MELLAVCLGDAQTLPNGKTKTGIAKYAVDYPVLVDHQGVAGDRIVNSKLHGGPDQAVYIEGALDRVWWEEELQRPLPPGMFGENLLISDLDNRAIAVGDRFHIDDVVLEVTSARTPCATFAARLSDPSIVKRYFAATRPGAYCRVISGGYLKKGQPVRHKTYNGDRLMLTEIIENHKKALPEETLNRYLAAPIGSRLREAVLG